MPIRAAAHRKILEVCVSLWPARKNYPTAFRKLSDLKYAVTMLLATPTFLNAYTRRCTPEDFGSLRFVMAGAEKLPARISQAFEDHFGIRPHEGYGCTECSPAVTVNTIDFRA